MSGELKHKLFTATDCLSEETMFDYIDNKLSDKERHQVEKHLLDCDFCSDAMEGLELVNNRSRINDINEEISNRIATPAENKNKIFTLNYKIVFSIAASLLLLLGGVFFFNNYGKKEIQEDKIAELRSPQLLPPPAERNYVADSLKRKDSNENQTGNFEKKNAEQVKPLFSLKEEKSQPDSKNSTGKGEVLISTPTVSNGISVTKSDEDKDKKVMNVPVQTQLQDQSKMVMQEVVAADEMPKKPEAVTIDDSGYAQVENEKKPKAKEKPEKKRDLKKEETKHEEVSSKFASVEGKKDKVAKEATPKANVTGNITSAPQTVAANKNMDFESTVTTENNRMLADSLSAAINTIPEFPGGNDSLNRFININFHYPVSYYKWDSNLGTKIIVAFTVDEKGKVVNPKIIKGINSELNNEALRVVNKMPDWKPATSNGKPVSSIFKLPIQLEIH